MEAHTSVGFFVRNALPRQQNQPKQPLVDEMFSNIPANSQAKKQITRSQT